MSDEVISGAQAGLRVLADGTVRLTIDLEPKDRVAAMTLFGAPGQSIALAALKDGHAQAGGVKEKAKFNDLGPICREAIKLCEKDSLFHGYVEHVTRIKNGCSMTDEEKADRAKSFICATCHVDSRKELDTAEGARELFIAHVRKPFHAWLGRQR